MFITAKNRKKNDNRNIHIKDGDVID